MKDHPTIEGIKAELWELPKRFNISEVMQKDFVQNEQLDLMVNRFINRH
jgi:hypothetical protein